MKQPWEFALSEGFPLDLERTPKKVHHVCNSWVLDLLKHAPNTPEEPKVKKLQECEQGIHRFHRSFHRRRPLTFGDR